MPAYISPSDPVAIMEQTRDTLQQQFAILRQNLDGEFRFVMGLWIIFMQCGFALLEAGAVRSKNTTNILFKNFLDVFVGALAYWIFGYGFAYGVPGNAFIGHNFFFSAGVDHRPYLTSNISESLSKAREPDSLTASEYYSNWLFQFAFAATASTIVSGAMAERTQFVAYLLYSFIITGFVYPILSHWCWSPLGFLRSGSGTGVHFIDFAGSGVVHVTGGIAALIGTYMLGPRTGRYQTEDSDSEAFSETRSVNPIRGHSVPMISMGGFILLTGFLAFNGGSQQSITGVGDGTTLSLAATNTLLAGSSGALTALIFNILFHHIRGKEVYLSLITEVNGALAGMVSSCAGSDDMSSWVAILLGSLAALLMVLSDHLLNRYHIDDPLGAVSVHLVGGLVGILLTPLFVLRGQLDENGVPVKGVVYSNHPKAVASFGWNLLGTICILAWAGLNCTILFGILKLTGLLRISSDDENSGLDMTKHGEPAYPETYYSSRSTICDVATSCDDETTTTREVDNGNAVKACV